MFTVGSPWTEIRCYRRTIAGLSVVGKRECASRGAPGQPAIPKTLPEAMPQVKTPASQSLAGPTVEPYGDGIDRAVELFPDRLRGKANEERESIGNNSSQNTVASSTRCSLLSLENLSIAICDRLRLRKSNLRASWDPGFRSESLVLAKA